MMAFLLSYQSLLRLSTITVKIKFAAFTVRVSEFKGSGLRLLFQWD